jgi:transposase
MSLQGSSGERKRNFVVHSEGREIISNIIEKCDEEKKRNSLTYPLNQATKRAAYYCSKSEGFIKNVRKERKCNPEGKLCTPGKKRKTREKRKLFCDDFDKCVVRNIVQEFYKNKNVVPTVKKLLPIVKERIHFPGGTKSLTRVLKSVGFKWRKCRSKRKVLIEKPDIIMWRYKYLVQIKSFRESGRNIFFLDETWVDSNITVDKCWQSNEVFGVLQNYSAGNRLVILHAGSKNGFVPGAKLVYKLGSTSGDYHGQMNYENFKKWVENMLQNIPPESVIVMDNAPYHSVLAEKIPTKYSTKLHMIQFLRNRGVHCDEGMRKEHLFQIIELHRPREKQYKIDQFLSSKGHTVVRLPPYMCDLNPIELAWAKVKSYIRNCNCHGSLNFTELTEITEKAIMSVTENDWVGYCKKVEEVEAYYWKSDGIVSDVIDKIIITSDSDDDNSSTTISSDSDDNTDSSDSDSDHNRNTDREEETDEELARPL